MRTTLTVGLILLAASGAYAGSVYPETREYILGDVDDFNYDGVGSVDDVYVDPDVVAFNLILPALGA